MKVVKSYVIALMAAAALSLGPLTVIVFGQSTANTVDAHVAAAKAAAGTEHVSVFNSLCMATQERASAQAAPAAAAPRPAAAPPARSAWHVEPVKVFDNLYYLGQSEYSAWAVTTSAGIIVVDVGWHGFQLHGHARQAAQVLVRDLRQVC